MRKLLLISCLILMAGVASAQTNSGYSYVRGYFKPSTGTYVQPYFRTNINSTNWDNYSTQGNVNPWTGSTGIRARDYSIDAYNYGGGKTVYTGPLGGQYYYNSTGNRTYVPKRYESSYSIPMYHPIQNPEMIGFTLHL